MAVPLHIYALPSDEIQALVTPTLVQGAANASYPLTNIYDGKVDTVFKPTSTALFEIQWDFGSARSIDTVYGFNFKIDAAAAVKVYVTSTAYAGAPIAGQTFSPTIQAVLEDGRRNGFSVDSSALGDMRYVRVLVPAQSADIAAMGEIKIISTKRTLTQKFQTFDEDEDQPAIVQTSDTGVSRVFSWGVTLRRWSVTKFLMHATTKAEFLSLWRSVGLLTPWVFVANPSAATQDPWLVRFFSKPIIRPTQAGGALWETSFLIEECSGGVPV